MQLFLMNEVGRTMLGDPVVDATWTLLVIDIMIGVFAAWVCYKMNRGKGQGVRGIKTVLAFFFPFVYGFFLAVWALMQ